MEKKTIRIALLHIALTHTQIKANVAHLEKVLTCSLDVQPDLIVTPELAVSGYEFLAEIGTDWIREQSQAIVDHFANWARQHQVALILGTPTHHQLSDVLYNSAVLIDEWGVVRGQHNKVSVLPGSEGWSTGAKTVETVEWNGRSLGILICADAYPPGIAAELAQQGAEVFISPAAWAPGLHEPNGEWEQRTQETGLTMIVCNRTGKENKMNFSGGTSVVVVNGEQVIAYADAAEAILTVDVDAKTWRPISSQFEVQKRGWFSKDITKLII